MTPTTGTLLFAHALVTNNNALKTLFGTILPANASAKESHQYPTVSLLDMNALVEQYGMNIVANVNHVKTKVYVQKVHSLTP